MKVRSYVYACLLPSCCRQAQDARHLGRYGPGGRFFSEVAAEVGVDSVSGMFTAGFAGISAFHAVFSTFVGWFIMPDTLVAGEVAALVDIGNCTFMAGFDGDDASAAFPSFVAGP